LDVLLPAHIVSRLTDVVVTNGTAVELRILAEGTEPLAYQWFKNATNLLPNATAASLNFASTALADTGRYSVVVSNAYGMQTNSALLEVLSAPLIISQPQDRMISINDSATFSVVATGNPQPSYQWFYNTNNLIDGATNATLSFTNAEPSQAGGYSVQLVNSVGTTVSRTAALSVLSELTIVSQPQPTNVFKGATASFSVVALGKAPLSYQWFFNVTNRLPGAIADTLVMTNVDLAKGGAYHVVVTNASSSISSQPATLKVLVPTDLLFINRTGTTVSFGFSTIANVYYSVYYATNLPTLDWIPLTKVTHRLGTGTPIIVEDTQATGPQRFYRIAVE
jgi:hypothetical protein